ncbi:MULTISPECIES: thermonuclease family protein [Rhizobium]|uniref:Thermonuclease family protein n=1 Tax=Rhizobium phaseoli TaxID=396 RepID=A0A7X6F590_9HYPH|nr:MULTISPECIES: thermonuclease family protein [Rhizobium]MDE8761993.1 thermonuclease family protein [Rhizobium sp. CBK13]NKF13546.1 thermonuclease family protein [Rhizobium phaseoli]QPK10958.1 thermonuclease family protein [Rhizobium phaseoli]
MLERFGLLPFFLISLGSTSIPAETQQLLGRASVVDGDTIEIGGRRIRLNGVDAPESWQVCQDGARKPYRCGKEAAFALDDFLSKSRPTSCKAHDTDRYGRVVADCTRADGTSVNSWLVRHGWAIDWVRYSKGAFKADQIAAKSAHAGIWRGTFELPCQARASKSKRKSAC